MLWVKIDSASALVVNYQIRLHHVTRDPLLKISDATTQPHQTFTEADQTVALSSNNGFTTPSVGGSKEDRLLLQARLRSTPPPSLRDFQPPLQRLNVECRQPQSIRLQFSFSIPSLILHTPVASLPIASGVQPTLPY